jgi:hypothetical protein
MPPRGTCRKRGCSPRHGLGSNCCRPCGPRRSPGQSRGVKKLKLLNPQGFMEVDEGLMKDLCRAPLWFDELETNARICHRFG